MATRWPEIRVYDTEGMQLATLPAGHSAYDHFTVIVQYNGRDPYSSDVFHFGEHDLGGYSGNLTNADAKFIEGALSREGNELVGKRLPWKDLPVHVRRNIVERLTGSDEGFTDPEQDRRFKAALRAKYGGS